MTFSASALREAEFKLDGLARSFDSESDMVYGVTTSSSTAVDTLEPNWTGPRSQSVLGTARDYVSTISTAAGALCSLGGTMRTWATRAGEVADAVESLDGQLAAIPADAVPAPGEPDIRTVVAARRTDLALEWITFCAARAREMDGALTALSGVAGTELTTLQLHIPGNDYQATFRETFLNAVTPEYLGSWQGPLPHEGWWSRLPRALQDALIDQKTDLVLTFLMPYLDARHARRLALTTGLPIVTLDVDYSALRQRLSPTNLWSKDSYWRTCNPVGAQLDGTIIAPDGTPYQVVRPELLTYDGDRYLFDHRNGDDNLFNLDGAEPGWRTVEIEQGIGSYGNSVPGWQKAIILLGGATGGRVSGMTLPAEGDAYEHLAFDPASGRPVLDMEQDERVLRALPAEVAEATVLRRESILISSAGRDTGMTRVALPLHNDVVGGRLIPLVDALAGAGTAADTLQKLDNADTFGFQVMYQHNDELGLDRAVVSMATISENDGEPTLLEHRGGVFVSTSGDEVHLAPSVTADDDNTRMPD
jgi:hypothetical protein